MSRFQIQTFNAISTSGLSLFPSQHYDIGSDIAYPDAIILRSFDLHSFAIPNSLKVVGRAGAGVNNIPVNNLTSKGIVVLNTPGANANAVKELVIASLLLGCRNICQAWDYVRNLKCESEALEQFVEKGKKQFSGFELKGRTLGIIGLGAIGVEVANAAIALGMEVIGFDPVITVKQAWRLDSKVRQATTLDQLIAQSNFITLHVPLNDETKGLINAKRISHMQKDCVLLNFSRKEIVEEDAVLGALKENKIYSYINDFPSFNYLETKGVISLPHLGASTEESEENCAVMVVNQIKDFLEQGNITNSVNFPEVNLPWSEGFRIAIINQNIPNMVGQISTILAMNNFNVLDLINKSKGDFAYTLIDLNQEVNEHILQSIAAIEGVISVRKIKA